MQSPFVLYANYNNPLFNSSTNNRVQRNMNVLRISNTTENEEKMSDEISHIHFLDLLL